MMNIDQLLEQKRHAYENTGFMPEFIPDGAFGFQRALIEWAVLKGRAALYADCGMGKSLMQLAFAENVVRKTNRPVLLLTPLAVGGQMVAEAEKFGIEAVRSRDGTFAAGARVVVANYERLHLFDASNFAALVCDESSILKNCDGSTKAAVTDFARKMSFRLLCTATPSPNDLIELGNSAEALGYLGFNDMLTMFFKKDEDRKTNSRKDEFRAGVWRFRGHAHDHFFRWVCSWARAVRRPSDLGFSDAGFKLPERVVRTTLIESTVPNEGFLMALPAVGLKEQRGESRKTLEERCAVAARLHGEHAGSGVAWCSLNAEGDALTRAIKGAVQVCGADTMECKEEVLEAFARGEILKLVTKPDICGFGLNWQHCHHQTFFPSHSFEQYYQAVRRSWRFGQKHTVNIDMITSEGLRGVMENMLRKEANAELLFENLIRLMGNGNHIETEKQHTNPTQLPIWLS